MTEFVQSMEHFLNVLQEQKQALGLKHIAFWNGGYENAQVTPSVYLEGGLELKKIGFNYTLFTFTLTVHIAEQQIGTSFSSLIAGISNVLELSKAPKTNNLRVVGFAPDYNGDNISLHQLTFQADLEHNLVINEGQTVVVSPQLNINL